MSGCRPDPTRPHKAIAGAISSGAIAGLALAPALPLWAVLVLTVAGAGAGAYAVPNPTTSPGGGEGEPNGD